MAETQEQKLARLKNKLRLIEVSLANAINQIKAGKVVSAGVIEDLDNAKAFLKDQIQKIEKGEETPLRQAQDSADCMVSLSEDDYGIPERLRIKRRPYTLSPEALEQRRRAAKSPKKAEAMKGNKNAWKTGEHAQGFIRQIFRPCKSTCPQYPCALVKEGQAEPGELCLDKVELVKALQSVQTALKSGKIEDFKDLVSVRLAGGMEVVKHLIEDILTDGTLIKSEKFDKEGAILGYEIKNHPSLLPLAKLIEALNITPESFMITPKEIARHKIDKKKTKTLADIMSGIGVRTVDSEEED